MSKYGHRTHNWFEAVVNKVGGEEAAKRLLSGELVVTETFNLRKRPPSLAARLRAKLLAFGADTIRVPACNGFVARERFVVGSKEAQIGFLTERFKDAFLDVVENAPTMRLKQDQIREHASDKDLLTALGGRKRSRVQLAHVFLFLMTAHPNRTYVFYVLDKDGKDAILLADQFRPGSNTFRLDHYDERHVNSKGHYVVTPA